MKTITKIIIFIIITLLVILISTKLHTNPNEKDLSDTAYGSDEVNTAMQTYLINEFELDYSKEKIESIILCSTISKTGTMYCLIQLPFISDGTIVENVDVVKIVSISKKNQGTYYADAYSPSYLLGTEEEISISDLPFIQITLPIVENEINFIATKIFDSDYKVFSQEEELEVNQDGIVGYIILSDKPLLDNQKPYAKKNDEE